ncbi:DUF4126 domain-containing protein [bacterium]|nr:DUF4126 domain-containing protein [bacterium]
METALGIAMGIALAAACGFRVFLPFLVISIAAQGGHLPLSDGFAWIGTTPAMIVFAAATVAEILAFLIPWVDNLLDMAAQPVAMIAGVLITAAVVTDLSPLWKWSLAIVAGGGIAGTLQGGTVVARGLSTLATGGLGNFVISAFEGVAALVTSVLAIVGPFVALALVVLLLVGTVRVFRRHRRRPAG